MTGSAPAIGGMSGPQLVDQLIADARLSKPDAERLAMFAAMAEGRRPIERAAAAAGIPLHQARDWARRFNITFITGGPA